MFGTIGWVIVLFAFYVFLKFKAMNKADKNGVSSSVSAHLTGDAELCSRLKLGSGLLKVSVSVPKNVPFNLAKTILKLRDICDPYIIFESSSSEQSEALVGVLTGIQSHRFLFHSSRVGKIAILRQLNPDLHMEFDVNIANSVFPHLSSVLVYGEGPANLTGENKIPGDRLLKDIKDILSVQL